MPARQPREGRSYSRAAASGAASAFRPETPISARATATSRPALDRLRKRADFLRAARGVKWVAPAFVLQARRREPGSADIGAAPRIGFTASRKVGNAVRRNRARRRLREAVRLTLAPRARSDHDYVLIARGATGDFSFPRILQDLDRAIHMVHKRIDAARERRRAAPTEPNAGAR